MEKRKFLLKKDGDSGYGKVKNRNILRKWKKKNDLKYFFNYISSFDLFFIKNCLQSFKQLLKKYSY